MAVIGGGNVAIDAARSAVRLGAAAVHMVCLESRAEMPAHEWEVEDALAEGVELHDSWGIRGFGGEDGRDGGRAEALHGRLRRRGQVQPRLRRRHHRRARLRRGDRRHRHERRHRDVRHPVCPRKGRKIEADPHTLQTDVPSVFAAGDAVSGPSIITSAVGQGQRAAFMIDRWLRGEELDGAAFDDRLPVVAKEDVLRRQQSHSRREPLLARAAVSAAPRRLLGARAAAERGGGSRERVEAASTAASAPSATSASRPAPPMRSSSTCASRSSSSR